MAQFDGGCHCGAVRLRIDVDVKALIECDCSLCTRKGILHIPVTDDRFRLRSGESDLVLYRFGTGVASHWFCRHCGIHAFGRPRSAPERYTVNARCLDDYHTKLKTLPVVAFDGINHPADRDA